jgi:hypothetical protein
MEELVLRTIDNGSQNTVINVMDGPGAGGACHEYRIRTVSQYEFGSEEVGSISFQNGPIKENGVNGCTQEDLLAIVIDRLRSFQAGGFACRENALALTKCEEAQMWLQSRTAKRVARGVEGVNVV